MMKKIGTDEIYIKIVRALWARKGNEISSLGSPHGPLVSFFDDALWRADASRDVFTNDFDLVNIVIVEIIL